MEFQKFNKIPRLSRDCIITEKIDGTSSQIFITNFLLYPDYVNFVSKINNDYIIHLTEDAFNFIRTYALFEKNGTFMFAGSRKRWLDCSSNGDNYGFAKWVKENAEELLKLGEGRHYGEWWGKGIQRGYGIDKKVFSLFNVGKWNDENKPDCCGVVPILWQGTFDTRVIDASLDLLKEEGSFTKEARYFKNPEGIIIYHTASRQLFKKTLENDEKPKGSKE